MINFVIANIETVSAALAAIFLLIYAIYTKQWGTVRSSALSFMLAAERLLTTVEGARKMDWVFAETWMRLPKWIKAMITEATLRKKLQQWYDWSKKLLKESIGSSEDTEDTI